jgi:hypothetical protein
MAFVRKVTQPVPSRDVHEVVQWDDIDRKYLNERDHQRELQAKKAAHGCGRNRRSKLSRLKHYTKYVIYRGQETMRQIREGLDMKIGVGLKEIENTLNQLEENKTL